MPASEYPCAAQVDMHESYVIWSFVTLNPVSARAELSETQPTEDHPAGRTGSLGGGGRLDVTRRVSRMGPPQISFAENPSSV